MIGKIIISVIMWLIYATSAITIIIVLSLIFKVLVWDNIKGLFKKKQTDKEVLKKLNDYKTFGDIKR